MGSMTKANRPSKEEHFMNRARVVAELSTCAKRKVGAIIIKDGVEISSGYVGSPRGSDHCIDKGFCYRRWAGIPSGSNYELCKSVHAEQNAIINAARVGVSVVGGQMYIYSEKQPKFYDKKAQKPDPYGPCVICKREIINAGIETVVMREGTSAPQTLSLDKVKEFLLQEEDQRRREYASPGNAEALPPSADESLIAE